MIIMESKTKHIAKQIGSIIFYLISGLLILYILLELFIPDMTIKVFQFKPFVVITESMEPVINVDDMVIVYNPNVDELEVGDIITFRADINYDGTKEIITHYIYSITENTEGELVFRTNRYGSDVADTWILQEGDVIGVYGFKIPQLGVFVNFLKSPFGIAAIAVNVIVIGAIVYIVKSGKKEAVQQENKEA
ncbi:MAG: signal peptidase I [Acholeplasma sp.]|nr:MAG: signal peptidase I [Acholeplasma sp.]